MMVIYWCILTKMSENIKNLCECIAKMSSRHVEYIQINRARARNHGTEYVKYM